MRNRSPTEDGGQFGAQDLERDLAVVRQVVREIDRGHATSPEFPVEAVAVLERGDQAKRGGAHGT